MNTVHAKDCTACDAARAVTAEWAIEFDPNDAWTDYIIDGVSEYDRLVAMTAEVLHGFPIPGGKR